jgi:Nuclear pore protein 84 / 107
MEDIEPDSERIKQLENARKFNLDTAEIIRETMQLTLAETREEMEVLYPAEGEPVNSIPLDDPISPLDQLQIRAIEWVSLANSEDLLLDTLINGNIVFRRFLRTLPKVWS